MLKVAEFLYSEGKGSLTVAGIAYYSGLGMRRTKQLIKRLNDESL